MPPSPSAGPTPRTASSGGLSFYEEALRASRMITASGKTEEELLIEEGVLASSPFRKQQAQEQRRSQHPPPPVSPQRGSTNYKEEETATIPRGDSSEEEAEDDDDKTLALNHLKRTRSVSAATAVAMTSSATAAIPQQQLSREQEEANEIRNREYSLRELVQCLNSDFDSTTLPPELYRRVLDYRLAQTKRFEKYGLTKKWGIYGVYKHLANVRTDLEWAEDAAWRRAHGHAYLSWNDFERWKRRHDTVPYFTYALITLCTIMLLVEFAKNGWTMEPLNVNPLMGPSAQTLVQLGALDTAKIVDEGQWFRLFSPIILHAGIIHWMVNMSALYFLGGALEQSHGCQTAICLFFIPAVGGNILSAIFLPQYISVGASGGIFGHMGSCIADLVLHWNLLFLKEYTGLNDNHNNQQEEDKTTRVRNFWAFFWLLLEICINILLGLTPYVDNFIHLGGFFYGILCGWSFIEYEALNFLAGDANIKNDNDNDNNERQQPLPSGGHGSIRTQIYKAWSKFRMFTLKFSGILISAALIISTMIWLSTMGMEHADGGGGGGGGDGTTTSGGSYTKSPCPGCRYFNCVPFPSRANPWWYCDDCNTVSAELFRVETSEGNYYYSRIELTCPDQETIEYINVTATNITERQDMIRRLPEYCRTYCDQVYQS